VEHRKVRWNGSNEKSVGEAVRADLPLAVPEQPVAVLMTGTRPGPAAFPALHVEPEPLVPFHPEEYTK